MVSDDFGYQECKDENDQHPTLTQTVLAAMWDCAELKSLDANLIG